MASSPMHLIARVGRKPHPVNTRKYGQPRLALYYANRRTFSYPGVHLWTGKRNLRIVPLPRREARP